MKEEDMDRYIRDLARRSYNPPPEPPRDELWARIQAARQATAPSADAPGDTVAPAAPPTDVIDIRSRAASLRRWTYRILPIAALLLVAFGLGRLSLLYERAHQGAVASGPTSTPATSHAPALAAGPAVTEPVGPTRQNAATAATQPADGTVQVPLNRSRLALATPARPGAAARSRTLYRLVAAQTLGQAEMLLTSFRAETRAGGTLDPQVITWAGDVLSSTRLLLDSPAGRDPKLRPLLEDLELVLAQIVQLRGAPAGTAGGDADLIDHALQQRDIMPRLRTAVPAGAAAAI
jgi:hypothetical protein